MIGGPGIDLEEVVQLPEFDELRCRPRVSVSAGDLRVGQTTVGRRDGFFHVFADPSRRPEHPVDVGKEASSVSDTLVLFELFERALAGTDAENLLGLALGALNKAMNQSSVVVLRNTTTRCMLSLMLKGSDILVLIYLAASPEPWTFRSLAEALKFDVAALHRSVERLKVAKLLDDERRLNRSNLEEFLIHGLRFVLPAELGPVGRGRPTAWAAEPLRSMMAESNDPLPVWPDPRGTGRGPTIQPISDGVVELADARPEIAEWLALLDAMRVGRARDKKLAADELRSRIWKSADTPA